MTHYFGLGGKVEIPDSLAITDIGQFAFSNFDYVPKGEGDEISEDDPTTTKQWFIGDDTITEVVIPEGVKTIGSYAFANLTALTKVVLPSTLERIDFGAFIGCSSLMQVEGIENVKFINQGAFEGCALKDKIDLKSAVAIADRAFAGNTGLYEVVLGEGVQSVGAYAFAGDTALRQITIKAEMIKLGRYAFDRCESLEAISINAAVIPTAAFNECKSLKTVRLGASVAVISEYAFSNAAATEFNVDENNSVFAASENGEYLTNKAGDEILLLAPGIKGDVVISDPKITSVGSGAFSGNANITSLSIPSVTKVSSYAFAYSENLASIRLGFITEIGDYAFYRTKISEMPSLEKVSLIGSYAFAYTSVTSLDVPAGVTVGEGAFRECKALASVTVGDGAVIEKDAFRLDRETNFTSEPGSYRDESNRLVYYYIYTSPLHSLTIGNNVTIGDGAFMGAAELESVTLGNGTIIGKEAFYNAVSLKSFDFTKVIEIGAGAFSGDVLYEFSDQSMSEPRIDANREYTYKYYAPAFTSIDLSKVRSIGDDAFAYCRELVSVKLGSGITAIPARALNICVKLTDIDLSKVKSVGENAFCETALTLADLSNANKIDKFAFVYNAELAGLTLAKGAELGEGAFSYCDALATVNGSAGILNIGAYAFAYTAITDIDVSGAESIGDHAFLKKEMTEFSIVLGEKLTDVGEDPFALCKLARFEKIIKEEFNGKEYDRATNTYDISETVKVIDGNLYEVVPNGLVLVTYAGDGDSVTVAEGTVRISAQAFAESNVKYVTLPSTLSSIGHKAFYGCDNLVAVTFTSYTAPVLEEEYDYSYWLSAENLPATGKYQYQDSFTGETVYYDGLGIVPYFMWNATDTPAVIYFGASFVDYVGHVEDSIAMIKPVNGVGYDSFILGKYFSVNIEGAAAADETTLDAITAIDSLPDEIKLEHKALVEAARAAYDKISSYTQRALVSNYDKLVAAEQRISDLEYLANGDAETEAPPTDQTPDNDKIDTELVIFIILCCACGCLLIAVIVLTVVCIVSKKRMKLLKKTTEDPCAKPDEYPTEQTENGKEGKKGQ